MKYTDVRNKKFKKNLARFGMVFLFPLEIGFITMQMFIANLKDEETARNNKLIKFVENYLVKADRFLEFYIHEGKKSPLRQEGEKLNTLVKDLKYQTKVH